MKDTIKVPSIDTGIDITKMHGHMDIYLTDVNTGKVEEVHEDNMMTNALQEFFRNCGFLNYPNVDQSNMVVELLGGVMGFSEEIDEDATIVHVPAGNKMVFNGSIGTLNNSAPTELGSYSADESGWQQDGSYVQTYDYSTSQANGTISCVCLTGRNYGYAGEGNSASLVAHNTKINVDNLRGSTTNYSVSGEVFNVSLSDSSCYTFSTIEVEEGGETVTRGRIRKYRLPLSKINIKGTLAEPIILSETVIQLDEDFLSATIKLSQAHDGKLLFWNCPASRNEKWGDNFTQYLWTLTPSGTMTKQTVVNATGVTGMYGLTAAIFDGNYCFFPRSYEDSRGIDMVTDIVYVWNRSNNTMLPIENDVWWDGSIPVATATAELYKSAAGDAGFIRLRGSGDGRIVTYLGTFSQKRTPSMVYDAVALSAAPTNISNYSIPSLSTITGLICHSGSRIYRDQTYIATINNLLNPVVKTSDKTMKVVYRITFDE